jgi:hypothetical protein
MYKIAELPRENPSGLLGLFVFGLRSASAVGERGDEKSGVAAAFGHGEILCRMGKKVISTATFMGRI